MSTIMGPYTDETPASELIGVQFSLLSSKELLQLSVYENGQSLERAKDLCDPRLGLPAHTGKCYTCNAETTDQCEGHFGHIVLPFCVYNPFLIRHVARILQRLCLNCYKLKKKQVIVSGSLFLPPSPSYYINEGLLYPLLAFHEWYSLVKICAVKLKEIVFTCQKAHKVSRMVFTCQNLCCQVKRKSSVVQQCPRYNRLHMNSSKLSGVVQFMCRLVDCRWSRKMPWVVTPFGSTQKFEALEHMVSSSFK